MIYPYIYSTFDESSRTPICCLKQNLQTYKTDIWQIDTYKLWEKLTITTPDRMSTTCDKW